MLVARKVSADDIKRRRPRLGDADDGIGITDEERKIHELGPRETIMVPVGDRVVRKQGCWNCTAFDNEALATRRFEECRLRDVRLLLQAGHTLESADAVLGATDHLTKPPMQGICLKGKSGSDFVALNYLCEHWNGRVNTKVTPGQKADLLPAELIDRLGHKKR